MLQEYNQFIISSYGDLIVYLIPTDMFSDHLLSIIDNLKMPPIIYGDEDAAAFDTDEERLVHENSIDERDPRVIHDIYEYGIPNHMVRYPKDAKIVNTYLWLNPWSR